MAAAILTLIALFAVAAVMVAPRLPPDWWSQTTTAVPLGAWMLVSLAFAVFGLYRRFGRARRLPPEEETL